MNNTNSPEFHKRVFELTKAYANDRNSEKFMEEYSKLKREFNPVHMNYDFSFNPVELVIKTLDYEQRNFIDPIQRHMYNQVKKLR